MTRILVSHDDKVIWVAVAKVASMAIQGAMTRMLKLPFTEWRRASLPSLAEVHRHSDYFRFAFVRNPWSRLYSCYRDKIVGPAEREQSFILGQFGFTPGMSFDHFVHRVADIDDTAADPHFVSQFHVLSFQGQLVVDFVGRFERLREDWQLLRDQHGLPILGYDPAGSPRAKHDYDFHKRFYTSELIELVRRRYSRDIEEFGYEF
jgi:hypothetical protein